MELFSSYTGADFLVFYGFMLAMAVAAGFWIPANMRPAGKPSGTLDAEEMAVLSGGALRHAQTVCTDLIAKGALTKATGGKLQVIKMDVEASKAGNAVLRKVGAFDLRELQMTTALYAGQLETHLEKLGLLMDAEESRKLRLLSIAPYVLLLALGLYRAVAGSMVGEPIGLLIILMLVTLGCAVWCFDKYKPRTKAGDDLLRQTEVMSSRIERAPKAHEAPLAVAVFGTGVLIGTPWEPVHAAKQSAIGAGGSNSGGCGGSSNSDGGGCGGGGCGGCGG